MIQLQTSSKTVEDLILCECLSYNKIKGVFFSLGKLLLIYKNIFSELITYYCD